MLKLQRQFYARPTLEVASGLLGKYLVFKHQVGKIVEVEAYLGPEDLASHARFSSRSRNQLMFGPPGIAYIYLTYGLHHMLNVITEQIGQPGGVLIRAIEPISGLTGPTSGPGRLTKTLGLSLSQNGLDLEGSELYLEDRGVKIDNVAASPRIGVSYAREYATKPWRFYIIGNPYVSKQ